MLPASKGASYNVLQLGGLDPEGILPPGLERKKGKGYGERRCSHPEEPSYNWEVLDPEGKPAINDRRRSLFEAERCWTLREPLQYLME